jgi:hypothetical protein
MEHYSRWTVYGRVTGTSPVLVNAAVEALAALAPARVTPLVPAPRLVLVADRREAVAA